MNIHAHLVVCILYMASLHVCEKSKIEQHVQGVIQDFKVEGGNEKSNQKILL